MLIFSLLASMAGAPLPALPDRAHAAPVAVVLVEPSAVTDEAVAQWQKEGFTTVAVVLDERTSKNGYAEVARRVSGRGLALDCWIEVGRNAKMAAEHPRWMAALGMHDDWRKNFQAAPEPGSDEVAKAFPWVPIGYQEAFEAHLVRIQELLQRAPPGWSGLLLNDLQAGPSSCGCGNLQCRWAIDYQVHATTLALDGDDVAARFVAAVRKQIGDKKVIPVWTTECEESDLPTNKHQGHRGTGLCGTVGCAVGTCPEVFSRQWKALIARDDGPVGLLALHTVFGRTQPEFGGGPGWVTNVVGYLKRTLPAHGGQEIPADRLWVVVGGSRSDEETAAREAAAKAGVAAVIVARAPLDQSYEPRLIRAK